MDFFETILLKKGIRTDALWTHPLAYKTPLKLIPLFLDTWALMNSQYWPREKLAAIQVFRLKTLLRDVRRNPFWRDVFAAHGIQDTMEPKEILAKIPVTRKKELNEKSIDYIADTTLLGKSDGDHTSGSTGKPFHFYQDWHSSLRSFAVTERIFRTATKGTRFPIVYMRARPRNGFTFYRHLWFFLRGFNSIPYRMDDFMELGRRFPRGFILYGYTSWVIELARNTEKRGMTLPLRAVMVAGEHLTAHDRTYVERVMKAEVFTLYASREVGFLGHECEYHNIHLSEEWAYIEIVDEKGRVLPIGKEGRIIVTTFDNRVIPFIRYEIGDIGAVSDEPCPCGRTLRTLTFKGRAVEMIALDDNRTVSLLDLAFQLGSYKDSVRNYQIIQKSTMLFVFRIVPGPLFQTHRENIEMRVVRILHPRVQIQWEFVEEIPEAKSGKAAYFVRDFTE